MPRTWQRSRTTSTWTPIGKDQASATGSIRSQSHLERPAAAFDTRIHASTLLTGQASKGIAKRLHKHGCTLVVEPESFFVDKSSHLEPDEADRATRWGRSIADAVATTQTES